MDGWVDNWVDVRANGWMDRQTDGWVGVEWIDRQTERRSGGQTDGRGVACMHEGRRLTGAGHVSAGLEGIGGPLRQAPASHHTT